jgi:hypothetical protein
MHHMVSRVLRCHAYLQLHSRVCDFWQDMDPSKLTEAVNQVEPLRSQHEFHARYVKMRDGLAS